MSKGIATEQVRSYLQNLQDSITNRIRTLEPSLGFVEDTWEHASGGGGRARVLENGHVFERGGVNFSHVKGSSLPPSATQSRPELANAPFEAMGVSLVLHPENPYVPTSHMNVRCFAAQTTHSTVWWFGGGFDLTPYYIFEDDCQHWHKTAKTACDPFGETIYPEFKEWCDRYFYLKHRQQTRGIGGLFFDDLNRWDFDMCFALMQNVGNAFSEAYFPIVEKRKDTSYGERERDWQLYRRGRYVEFNLVYDRGTLFGLQSGGRTESILMSMPPLAKWQYNRQPEPDSPEAQLYDFLQPRDWIG